MDEGPCNLTTKTKKMSYAKERAKRTNTIRPYLVVSHDPIRDTEPEAAKGISERRGG